MDNVRNHEPGPAKQSPSPTVWHTLQAHDCVGLIDFLVNVVGFTEVVVHADGETVHHAQLAWPEGGGIMLGSYSGEKLWSRPPGTNGAYVVTDDVDGLYDRVKKAGATTLAEPTDRDYGGRDFTLKDPEGNLWNFGTYRGEPLPRGL